MATLVQCRITPLGCCGNTHKCRVRCRITPLGCCGNTHKCLVRCRITPLGCCGNTQKCLVRCRITLLSVLQNTPTVLLLHSKGCSRSTPLNIPGVPNWHMQPSTPKGVPETPFFNSADNVPHLSSQRRLHH